MFNPKNRALGDDDAIAEYYRDLELLQRGEVFNPEEKKYLLSCSGNNPVCNCKWLCRDGRIMLIAEMNDSHLINSMRRVERMWPWRAAYYHCLVKEAIQRNLI